MATDKLINMDQGDDIIDALSDIATNINTITYGPQTSADKVVSMTGYQKSSATDPGAISQGDTLNEAVGKLEKRVDNTATAIADKIESYTDATTSGHVVTFNNSTGTQVTDSGVSIATSTTGVTDVDTTIPTSKSVVAYAATKDHTHNYAGSSSAGGAATSADKLNIGSSNIGSATQPVYFDKTTGQPVAITNTIQSDVPANAVFTDTTYTVAEGTANGKIKVTPSSGTAYEVPVHGLGNAAYKGVATSVSTSEDLVTSKAVNTKLASYVPNSDFVVTKQNILYNAKTGAQNLMVCNDIEKLKKLNNSSGSWEGNVFKDGSGTFTINDDGSITVNGTFSAQTFLYLENDGIISASRFKDLATVRMFGCPTGGSESSFFLAYRRVSPNYYWFDVGSGIDIGTISASEKIMIFIGVRANVTMSNKTFYPALVLKSIYNQDSNFCLGALPNSDLTALEAADRSALAEEIDAGAKNKIQIISPTTTIGNITFTINSDGSITVNGSANTTDTFYYLNAANGTSGYINFNTGKAPCFLTGCPSGGAADTYELQISSSSGDFRDRGTGVDVPANITGSPVIAIRKNYAPSNLKFYPMLCTKAAFGVSSKFVPYRPNWDLVFQYVSVPRTKIAYCDASGDSKTHKYTMQFSDFTYAQFTDTQTCGTYLVSVVTWGYTPKHGLWVVSYSGGNRSYTALTNIVGADAATVSVVTDDGTPYIQVVASGKVTISTLN